MGAHILVVEDNALNRRLVCDILEIRGHRVSEAGSVEEGRAQLRESLPDLVLLDIQIPGGGGEVLLREIRGDPDLARLPVIAVTAQAMAGDKDRLLRAGFDGYLAKPISARAFGPEVEAFLREVKTKSAREGRVHLPSENCGPPVGPMDR